jgi:hypothetical protein
MRQHKVIANLEGRRLPTDQAEAVLRWLEEQQRQFESHYDEVLSDGKRRIELFIERGGSFEGRRSPRKGTATR